jgi:salicylate biosynthesis isochorismate synthase/menaquinone-specific isochorismate synthase
VTVRAQDQPFVLPTPEREVLARRLGEAIRRARRSGRTAIAALGWSLDPEVDPTAVVVGSRRAQEPWFCLEQPDRGRVARAALGCVAELEATGPERFRTVARQWRELAGEAVCEPDDGLAALGGFAFAPDGGSTPAWAGFTPASLHVPEVLLVRRGGEVRLTVAVLAAPDDTPEDLLARADRRLAELRQTPLPLLDPGPGRARAGQQRDATRALRVGGGARRRADPRGRHGQDRPRARGPRARAGRPRPRCGARRSA